MKLVFSSMMIGAAALFSVQTNAAKPNNEPVEQAEAFELRPLGSSMSNDGSFNYQGFLEFNGAPANGMYSFRFEAFEDATGDNSAHENLFISTEIPVVDGHFNLDVQMGGTPEEAKRFWREVGDQEMYLEIGISEFQGGPYTTLSTRSKLGWSARAQYSGISESLRFPYTDSYSNGSGDPSTMISLTNEFGGTVAELRSNRESDEPIAYIRGDQVFSPIFNFQSGALLVDSKEDEVGIRGEGLRYSVVGFFSEPSTLPGVSAAVLGSVGFGSTPDVVAVYANNSPANTSAQLANANFAGEFFGDVQINGNLQVQGAAEREFGVNQPAPIGPVAYGSISSTGVVTSGTANLSASYNALSQEYVVSISGESINFSTSSVHVTVVDSNEPRVATFNSVGGDILVKVWDINSGNIAVQDNFSIVIYRPDPNSFVLRGAPNGVDSDKYYEQSATTPVIGTMTQHKPFRNADPSPIEE